MDSKDIEVLSGLVQTHGFGEVLRTVADLFGKHMDAGSTKTEEQSQVLSDISNVATDASELEGKEETVAETTTETTAANADHTALP